MPSPGGYFNNNNLLNFSKGIDLPLNYIISTTNNFNSCILVFHLFISHSIQNANFQYYRYPLLATLAASAAVAEASPAVAVHPGSMELIDLWQDAHIPAVLQQQFQHTNSK
jgi:hypothetical protein